MKKPSLLSFLFCSILCNGLLLGQTPYCKKVLLGPNQNIHSVPSMHSTPDGNWLIPAVGNNFIGILKMSPTGGILDAHRVVQGPSLNCHISSVCELPNGNILSGVEYDTDPGPEGIVYFLKCFKPDFTEAWSLQFLDKSSVLPLGGNQFVITSGKQIIKINASGQILWAKELSSAIQKAHALPNGNLVVSLLTNTWDSSDLALIGPDGSILKSLDLPILSIYGCYVDIFPGGDILICYNNSYGDGMECQRHSPDLDAKQMWRITNPGISEFPKVAIASDSLVFFNWRTGEGPGSVLGTMDGLGNLLKSVVLPFFLDFPYTDAILTNGTSSWYGVSPLLIEPGILVYSLDSTLTLPNCNLPVYNCLESKSIWVENLQTSVTAVNTTLDNQQYTLPWQQFSATIQDSCMTYTQPDPYFAIQDTLCIGTTIVPDSLMAFDAASNIWTLNMDGHTADTLYSFAPSLLFDHPGPVTVIHQVYYMGCQTDSFSRTVHVLPAPLVDLGADTSLCDHSVFLLNPEITGANHWHWNDLDTSIQKVIVQNGLYSLEASNGICSVSDTIEIKFGTADAAFGVVSGICSGEFFIPVPVEAAGANHLWHLSPPILPDMTTEQPNIGIAIPGTYQLTHTVTREGCTDHASESILVVDPVEIEMPTFATVCSDSILSLIPNTAHALSFYWEDGSTSLERSIENGGIFTCIASNEFCSDTATIEVTEQVCESTSIYVPNVFAPQANNENASFQAYYNEAVDRLVLMEIYDRWGSLIFKGSEGASWDGTNNGRPAAPGVYIYRVDFHLAEGGQTQRKGTVTLIR